MSALCKTCRALNISLASFQTHDWTDAENNLMKQLGLFHDIEKRVNCPLCVLLTQAFRNGPVQQQTAFEGSDVQGHWAGITQFGAGKAAALQIYLMGKFQDLKMPISLRLVPNEGQVLCEGAGRMIDEESTHIPFDMVKEWIYRCEHDHSCRSVPLASTRNTRLPKSFTVIDVESMCLVTPAQDCRFFALSYVWGKSNRFVTSLAKMRELSEPGSLEMILHLLAPPIRDAILLTRKLGERYIWIDAVCISQSGVEGTEMAKENIQAMDSIYRHAVCTIIAADEDAPDLGLAGVGYRPRRVQQHIAEILPGVKVLARYSGQTHMIQSRYRSRGWTYQEEELATRSLIFTANQVYFSCPMFAYAEDIAPASDPDVTLVSHQRHNKIINPGVEGANPAIAYFASVEAFTARNLRFASDSLRAHAGAEAVLSQLLGSQLYEGLPACIFDVALLWQPKAKVARRGEFPSWSWAGWAGQVHWLGDTFWGTNYRPGGSLALLNTSMRAHTWIVYYLLDGDGHARSVWGSEQHHSIGDMFWPVHGAQPRQPVGYQVEPSNDTVAADPYGRTTDMSKAPLNLLPSGSKPRASLTSLATQVAETAEFANLRPLLFTTLMTRLFIKAAPNSYIRYGSLDPVWVPAGRLIFMLYLQPSLYHEDYVEDSPAGYVLLDDSYDLPEYDLSEQEFLLMSEANYDCQYGRPHARNKYKQYWDEEHWEEVHIMMVKHRELDNGARVTERLGIGRVMREALSDSDSRVEVVDVALV